MNIFPGHISFLISHGYVAHGPFRLPSAARCKRPPDVWLTAHDLYRKKNRLRESCSNLYPDIFQIDKLLRLDFLADTELQFCARISSKSTDSDNRLLPVCHQLFYLFVISCRRK